MIRCIRQIASQQLVYGPKASLPCGWFSPLLFLGFAECQEHPFFRGRL